MSTAALTSDRFKPRHWTWLEEHLLAPRGSYIHLQWKAVRADLYSHGSMSIHGIDPEHAVPMETFVALLTEAGEIGRHYYGPEWKGLLREGR